MTYKNNDTTQRVLIPVILSGGAGSRLWPVSREQHPKPFMKLSDGETLLQKAFKRAALLLDVVEILTVTNREFYFKSEEAYKTVNPDNIPTSYILEPIGRNTAAAVACATSYVGNKFGSDAMLMVLTADQLIGDKEAFYDAVLKARTFAEQDKIVTFGVTPNAPETGYGYIEYEGNTVKRFIEKPNLALAKQYLASNNHLWNAGLFCFKASTMKSAFQQYAPDIIHQVEVSMKASQLSQTSDHQITQLELDQETFKKVPDISIDYAIMEKSQNMAVVPCDIAWTDIGSWDALSDLKNPDNNANSVIGEALLHDVSNCYIQSHNRIIGAVGIQNLIVVDTPDALLVADKSRSQDVKHIFNRLKDQNHMAYKLHSLVEMPWGSYTLLDENETFKVKKIIIKPGSATLSHSHADRNEQWTVTSGTAEICINEKTIKKEMGEAFSVHAGIMHQIINPTDTDLIMIKVETLHAETHLAI